MQTMGGPSYGSSAVRGAGAVEAMLLVYQHWVNSMQPTGQSYTMPRNEIGTREMAAWSDRLDQRCSNKDGPA